MYVYSTCPFITVNNLFSQKLHAEDNVRLPDSVLAYVEASRNRMNAFEQLILEDVEENGENHFKRSDWNSELKHLKVYIIDCLLEVLHCFSLFWFPIDLSSQEQSHLNHKDNPTTEPASDFIEDPIKWKEKVSHGYLFVVKWKWDYYPIWVIAEKKGVSVFCP